MPQIHDSGDLVSSGSCHFERRLYIFFIADFSEHFEVDAMEQRYYGSSKLVFSQSAQSVLQLDQAAMLGDILNQKVANRCLQTVQKSRGFEGLGDFCIVSHKLGKEPANE